MTDRLALFDAIYDNVATKADIAGRSTWSSTGCSPGWVG